MVVAFHFFSRWGGYFPFGQSVDNVFFRHLYLGVELFFIISGFVIALTLSRARNLRTFLTNRATRLYPALVMLLPLVFVVQRYIPGSPFISTSTVGNLFSSMTLLPPKLLSKVFGEELNWLTLVLWSLKVEIFFYLLAGFLFFTFRKLSFFIKIHSFGALVSLWYLAPDSITAGVPGGSFVSNALDASQYYCLPWFLIGIVFFQIRNKDLGSKEVFVLIIYSLLAWYISEPYSANTLERLVAIFLVVGLATVVIGKFKISRVYNFAIFQKIGSSSYEMYLLHQGLGIPLCIYIFSKFSVSPMIGIVVVISIIILLFFFSAVVQLKLTGPINQMLRKKFIS